MVFVDTTSISTLVCNSQLDLKASYGSAVAVNARLYTTSYKTDYRRRWCQWKKCDKLANINAEYRRATLIIFALFHFCFINARWLRRIKQAKSVVFWELTLTYVIWRNKRIFHIFILLLRILNRRYCVEKTKYERWA